MEHAHSESNGMFIMTKSSVFSVTSACNSVLISVLAYHDKSVLGSYTCNNSVIT